MFFQPHYSKWHTNNCFICHQHKSVRHRLHQFSTNAIINCRHNSQSGGLNLTKLVRPNSVHGQRAHKRVHRWWISPSQRNRFDSLTLPPPHYYEPRIPGDTILCNVQSLHGSCQYISPNKKNQIKIAHSSRTSSSSSSPGTINCFPIRSMQTPLIILIAF